MFLHGIGVGPNSWDAQIAALPEGYTGVAPQIRGLVNGDESVFTLASAAAVVISEFDQGRSEKVHLCGLSLGAMIAVQIAIEYPERVASLVLSGGQVHPPRALMMLQSALIRVLPTRLVAGDGTSKQRMLAVLAEVANIDFRPHLSRIQVPTLVLCGSKDIANLPAARALQAGIPNARLRIIAGGGHELNTQKPDEFNSEMAAFLREIS